MGIITDGEDNSSKKFSANAIKATIEKLTSEGRDWEFRYLGANQNPLVVSESLGIASSNAQSFSFSKRGFKSMYKSLNEAVQISRVSQYQKRLSKGYRQDD